MLYALVARDASFAVDVFVTRADAEQALRDALADEPQWWSLLAVVDVPRGEDAYPNN